jgi:VWFA-related protein
LLAAGQAQQPPTIQVDVRLVLVEASVTDATGKQVTQLKREDFLVFEEGVEQKIEHFSQDELPLEVLELTHLSPDVPEWRARLQQAWREAWKGLDPKKDSAVAVSGLSGFLVRHEKPDTEETEGEKSRELRGQEPRKEPSIEEALSNAARFVRGRRAGARGVIILVSDRLPVGRGRTTPEEMQSDLLRAETTLYFVQIAPGEVGARGERHEKKESRKEWRARESVEAAVQETGGRSFTVGSIEDVGRTMRSVIQTVKTRYTLGFYPANKTPDGKLRKIEVKLQPSFGVKGKDYSVVAKRGYYPATK